MIWTLFRLDPSIRSLWSHVAWGVLGGVILRRLVLSIGSDFSSLSADTRGWISFCYGLAWFVCLLFLFSANFLTRTGKIFTHLPLGGRTLWLVRISSILLVASLPILVITLLVSFRSGVGGEGFYFEDYYLLQGLKGCAALILAALIFQAPQPDLQKISPGAESILGISAVSIFMLFFVILTPAGIWPIILLLLPAVFLMIYLTKNIPPSFLIFPTDLDEQDWRAGECEDTWKVETTKEEAGVRGPNSTAVLYSAELPREPDRVEKSGSRILQSTLFRLIVNHWRSWLLGVLCLLYAVVLPISYQGGEDPLPSVLFISVWLVSIFHNGIIRLARLDHLPLTRRLLFAYVALPAVFPIVAGLLIGTSITYLRTDECQVCYGKGREIEVPPEFLEIAWDGKPGQATSPWGETHSFSARPLFPGVNAVIFNPFEASQTNSARFYALQANRAVEKVHGQSQFTEASIMTDEDNPLVDMMSKRDEYKYGFPIEGSKGNHSELHLRTWLLGGTILICLWTFLGVVGMLKYRYWPLQRFFSILLVVLVSTAIAILVLQISLDITHLLGQTKPLLFILVLVRKLVETLSLSSSTLFLVLILASAMAYKLIERLFLQIELPLNKVKAVWKEYG